jgi:hypothetical protein
MMRLLNIFVIEKNIFLHTFLYLTFSVAVAGSLKITRLECRV